ncbi:MAG: hypothetical protein OXB84_08045 [Halobacteriovoraceae bacterium]|nr:hypothetical protein [Halobacteriovoraceae bacterium]
MKKHFKKLSFLVVCCHFFGNLANARDLPKDCLRELAPVYQALKNNPDSDLLDVIKKRSQSAVYRYSKAYLEKYPGDSSRLSPDVAGYLDNRIRQNHNPDFDAALNQTFNGLNPDISSFPADARAILNSSEFNPLDRFIIKGLLDQSSCEKTCSNKRILDNFNESLRIINTNHQDREKIKRKLEQEYNNLADGLADQIANRFRNYIARQQENEECREFLKNSPSSLLQSVDDLLFLGCETDDPLLFIEVEIIEEITIEIIDEGIGDDDCLLLYLDYDVLECPSTETDSAGVPPTDAENDNVWSLSLEQEGRISRREVKIKAKVTKPKHITATEENPANWGSFSWKCGDEDCGDGGKELTIDRKNKSLQVTAKLTVDKSNFSGGDIPEAIEKKTDVVAYCEDEDLVNCGNVEDEEESETQEEANIFDNMQACYVDLNPESCNQMIPPYRGTGLPPPDPVSWTSGHN